MDPHAYVEMSLTEDQHWWFVARRGIVSDCISRLNLPPTISILEVGCGTGGNLNMLSKFGSIHGIEMDQEALHLAHKKTGHRLPLSYGKCPDAIPFDNERFDLICLLDVIEHIEDDVSALLALKERLAPGGKIVITVPAHPWMFGAHDTFLHHYRRYTKPQLAELLLKTGLEQQRMTYFNCLLFPLTAMTRLVEKVFSRKQAIGTQTPSNLINKTLCAIFSSERTILKNSNLPFGVSLLCVAKSK